MFLTMRCSVIFWLVLWLGGGSAFLAKGEAPDYVAMVTEIETLLTATERAVEAAEWEQAQEKATAAYFHVFEHMEGPIRLNLGQGTNFRLELQFAKLRRLIADQTALDQIQSLITPLREELRALPPQLEGGFTMVAEAETADPVMEALDPELAALLEGPAEDFLPQAEVEEAPPPARPIDPVWVETLQVIQTHLFAALAAYESGAKEEAREAVREAQFAGYKNTMMETAVRRHRSQSEDAHVNYTFAQISSAIAQDQPLTRIGAQVEALLVKLEELAPDLPVPEAVARKMDDVAEVRWDGAAIAQAVESALANGASAEDLKQLYFEQYHAGGLRAQLRAEDPAQNLAIEAAFSTLVEQLEQGMEATELSVAQANLKAALALPESSGFRPSALIWPFALLFAGGIMVWFWQRQRPRPLA